MALVAQEQTNLRQAVDRNEVASRERHTELKDDFKRLADDCKQQQKDNEEMIRKGLWWLIGVLITCLATLGKSFIK